MNIFIAVAIILMVCGMIGIAYDNGVKYGRLLERIDYLNKKSDKYNASI